MKGSGPSYRLPPRKLDGAVVLGPSVVRLWPHRPSDLCVLGREEYHRSEATGFLAQVDNTMLGIRITSQYRPPNVSEEKTVAAVAVVISADCRLKMLEESEMQLILSLPRAINFNLYCSLTRNITSLAQYQELVFSSLLVERWLYYKFSHYLTYTFLFKRLGECTF